MLFYQIWFILIAIIMNQIILCRIIVKIILFLTMFIETKWFYLDHLTSFDFLFIVVIIDHVILCGIIIDIDFFF